MMGIFSSRNADSPVGNESRHHIELLDGIIDKWNHWFVQIREKRNMLWVQSPDFFPYPPSYHDSPNIATPNPTKKQRRKPSGCAKGQSERSVVASLSEFHSDGCDGWRT